jgi:hypothetical protein
MLVGRSTRLWLVCANAVPLTFSLLATTRAPVTLSMFVSLWLLLVQVHRPQKLFKHL